MANESTRAPGAADDGGDLTNHDVAKMRETALALVRRAALRAMERAESQEAVRGREAVQRNRELEQAAGIRSPRLSVDHGTLRMLLMNLLGVSEEQTPAFDSRLKHTLRQGIVPDDRPSEGDRPRGHRRYLLIDVLQLALVFQLQRALIDPAAAAAFVIENREELERQWTAAARALDHHWLEIEVDAYAALGAEGKGRASGRVGALAFPGTRPRRGIAEPALVLRVDMLALHDRVSSSMMILDDAARLVRVRYPGVGLSEGLRRYLDHELGQADVTQPTPPQVADE
jgi:hypothetical protein